MNDIQNADRRGTMIYWEVKDFEATREQLEALGFGNYAPRNKARAALIKALKKITKGEQEFYRRFADEPTSVRFAVVNPETVQTRDHAGKANIDIEFHKRIVIHLDKKTENLTIVSGDDMTFFNAIQRVYYRERETLDAQQFRAFVTRVVLEVGRGVPMRTAGGIYFIDNRKAEVLDKLTQIFDQYPGTSTLYKVGLYGDPDSMVALQEAVSTDIASEIDTMIREMSGDTGEPMTPRMVQTRKDRLDEVLGKVEFYRNVLSNRSAELKTRAEQLKAAVTAYTGTTHQTFLDMLGDI